MNIINQDPKTISQIDIIKLNICIDLSCIVIEKENKYTPNDRNPIPNRNKRNINVISRFIKKTIFYKTNMNLNILWASLSSKKTFVFDTPDEDARQLNNMGCLGLNLKYPKPSIKSVD